jgi:Tfp pilus assembly protein PilN
LAEDENGVIEAYGESPARPLFSAEFETGAARATALAAAELRLPPETAALSLEQILPAPRTNPVGNDLARRALPFAAALAGACPWLTPAANLLPSEQRSSNSRARLIPSLVLAGALLLLAGGLLAHSALEDRRYLSSLEAQIHQLDPQARQAAALDGQIAHAQARARLLDEFRARSKGNLDALNELTVVLAPPTWTNMIQIARDAVTLNGETEQAAPLLKLLDASPYFANSAFVGGLSRNGGNEQFQIRAIRKARP